MRLCRAVVLLLALGACASSTRAAQSLSNKDVETVLMQFISDLSKSLDGGSASNKRRLLTFGVMAENFHQFMTNMMGEGWQGLVPENWSLPSFDWKDLGTFGILYNFCAAKYSSNLGDFFANHDLEHLTNVTSVQDVAASIAAVESAFCTAEKFTPGKITPAACTGPEVSISLVPKTCVIDPISKQVVCDPAKLVLKKEPGYCNHKYLSASTWKGKECKIDKIVGFNQTAVHGGETKFIPLPDLHADVTVTPSRR